MTFRVQFKMNYRNVNKHYALERIDIPEVVLGYRGACIIYFFLNIKALGIGAGLST